MSREQIPPIPSLAEKYSGVSQRLAAIAKESKARLYGNRTLPPSAARKAPVRLPPYTTREAFDVAIQDLRSQLGQEHVVLNDQPLIDGWYLEHPNTRTCNRNRAFLE